MICFCLIRFQNLPLRRAAWKEFSSFSLFLGSGNTFTSLSLLRSLLFLRILDSRVVGDMFVLILGKTSQGEWEDLSGKTTAHVGMVSGTA